MKQLWKRIKRLYELVVRKIHGHTRDCCSHIRENCKRCPYGTDEVMKIVRNYQDREVRGYFEIKGGKK